MDLQQRINAFVQLGTFLREISSESISKTSSSKFHNQIPQILQAAQNNNRWFTETNIKFAFASWGHALTETTINSWLSSYSITQKIPNTIAIIMAGNIPLVGFHDFLSVLMSGNKVLAKLSSNDNILLPFLVSFLVEQHSDFKESIQLTEKKVTNFDAVIATGSDNTARYFEYYFGKYPHIIRKNRNSVAVLTGKETEEQLLSLSDDIFQYFGLGCRNVSKLFIPKEYDFHPFFEAMFNKKEYINNHKYINNYDYNKAVYLMSNIKLLDNEFLLLKQDSGYSSPISVVFYETYEDLSELQTKFSEDKDRIQAIVGNSGIAGEIPFGKAQQPTLWDYADGVDTMKFLVEL
ncbi:acyl-CoA reductase [Jejudonia soesokkakensis]|uniref:Acyl-CoA reductase n=1 Tax=Jejudonia soesokkakensis TaxID=1323432 RepID=A0ABW2MUF4_9FLAO